MTLRVIAVLTLLSIVSLLIPSPIYADCCATPIVMGNKPNPQGNMPPPPPGMEDEDYNENGDNGDTSGDLDGDDAGDELDIASLGGRFVEESRQQAVIAWNGKEQITVLTTNEKLLTKKASAVLHMMPLAGKVKDIYRADKDVFTKAKRLVIRKLRLSGVAGAGLFMERKFGAHNIFVWYIDDPKNFVKRIQHYVIKRFGRNARAYITKGIFDVIKSYYSRGYRYFAFDLVKLGTKESTKEAIAYHVETPKRRAFYPLVISSASAKGNTVVDLVLFSNGELKKLEKINGAKNLRRLGKKSVSITNAELRGVDARMAKLLAGRAIRGQIIQFSGKLEAFKSDFVAR